MFLLGGVFGGFVVAALLSVVSRDSALCMVALMFCTVGGGIVEMLHELWKEREER